MPRFVGRNTSAVNHNVKSSLNNAKNYGIAPAASFDINVPDVEAAEIIAQLDTLSGVSYVELDSLVQPKLIHLGTPAAKGTTDVHALIDSALVTDTTTGFTNPDVPRNLRVTKAASWDGGTVTVTGTDQNDNEIEEVFPALTDGLEVGVKVFKTVTAARRSIALDGGLGYSIGTGDKIGLGANVNLVDTDGLAFADGVGIDGTFDATYDAVALPTAPDGSVRFNVLVNI